MRHTATFTSSMRIKNDLFRMQQRGKYLRGIVRTVLRKLERGIPMTITLEGGNERMESLNRIAFALLDRQNQQSQMSSDVEIRGFWQGLAVARHIVNDEVERIDAELKR